VMRADGSDQQMVADGLWSRSASLTWSPDGDRIAVESSLDSGALRIFDLNGGFTDLRVQPQGRTIFVNNPDWSPDGTKIAVQGKFWELICDEYDPYYCDFRYSTADLYALEADGSGISRLTFDASLEEYLHDNSAPSWSPDGARIAFKRDAGIAVMDADGGDMQELVDSGGDPVWSPDGTKLAFGSNGAVFVVNADGSGQTKILDGAPWPATSFASPSWQPVPNRSPDCSGVMGNPSQLWPPNKKLRRVTFSGARDPDGDAVTLEVAGVTQDEPAGRAADSDIRDDGTVLLRAERDPQGDGRVYMVAFQVTDEHGGSCTGTAAVSAPRHKR